MILTDEFKIKKTENLESSYIENELSKNQFVSKIGDYLACLTKKVLFNRDAILITIGGETSRACCEAIESKYLQVVDAILPAIPLCIDSSAQLVVTKSGNLGTSSTLVEIIQYLEHHQNV